jgi:hypothetical protein
MVAALALAVAGCGGGSDEADGKDAASTGSTDAAAPSKAEFIRQVDAICTRGKKQVETEFASYLKKNKIKEIGEKGESPADAESHEIAVIETIAIPELQEQIEELKALQPPSDDEDEVEAFLDATEEGLSKGEEEPQALFSTTKKLFAKSDKLAQSYGFKVCGNR